MGEGFRLKRLEFCHVDKREAVGRGHSSLREKQSWGLEMRTVGGDWPLTSLAGEWGPWRGGQVVGVRVCTAPSMGPRCLYFICRHHEAAVLFEEGVSQPVGHAGVGGREVERWEARGRRAGDQIGPRLMCDPPVFGEGWVPHGGSLFESAFCYLKLRLTRLGPLPPEVFCGHSW